VSHEPEHAASSGTASRRNRRRWILFAVGAFVLVVFSGAVFFRSVVGAMERWENESWALLREAGAASATDQGAEVYYRAHPGLARRYPTPESFVAAARSFAPRLSALPATAPTVWDLLKGGSNLNIERSGAETTFTLSHYRGLSLRSIADNGALVDLTVE
jgi:hypothetical protein